MEAVKVENMHPKAREFMLNNRSTQELCHAYNNYFIKDGTEKDVAAILAQRGVFRCEALSKVTYPFDYEKLDTLSVADKAKYLDEFSKDYLCAMFLFGIDYKYRKEAESLLSAREVTVCELDGITTSPRNLVTKVSPEPVIQSNETNKAEDGVTADSSLASTELQDQKQNKTQRERAISSAKTIVIDGKGKKYINDIVRRVASYDMSQDSFETKKQFHDRIESYQSGYEGKTFEIDFDAVLKDEVGNQSIPYLKYNAEKQILVAHLPNLDLEFVGFSGERFRAFYSWIGTGDISRQVSSYYGSNAFGAEKQITKIRGKGMGLAVLTPSNSDMDGQHFAFQMNPQTAREFSENGKIRLILKTEAIRDPANTGLAMMKEWYMGENSENLEASVLLVESISVEPSMSDPRDIEWEKLGAPVRLLRLDLVDANGEVVASKSGEHQNTTYLYSGIF